MGTQDFQRSSSSDLASEALASADSTCGAEQAQAPATRRDFLRKSSALAAGTAMAGVVGIARGAHPGGNDEIKIGLIGAGGRGTGATAQALNTQGPVKLVAACDAFEDRLAGCLKQLSSYGAKIDVPKDRQFVGFDAYKKVLESDCELVILATPPGFRPLHLNAAIKAGKHVFAEKPLAVDAAGIRSVLETNKIAKEKNLAIAVGLQRHHEKAYIETVKRLQDGAIGDIVSMRALWDGTTPWVRSRQPKQTEMEYQMRNWYYFNWLCGDHIVEQHCHNIDVINWIKGDYPINAQGMGGREVRTGPDSGQIFDHHFVEFTYADGSKMFSQCRQMPGCWTSVDETVQGTKGHAEVARAEIYNGEKKPSWKFGRGGRGGHQEEHHDLFAALRAGKIPNEAEYGAMSTMTAILGRMATYSGKLISMKDALASELVISPVGDFHTFKDTPPVVPDAKGKYPLPIPGVTQVI